MTYVHVVRVPFHGRAHGIARATWAGAVLGLFTAVAAKGSGASEAQTLLAALFPFTGAAAGAGAWLRLRAAYRIAVKFSELGRDVVPEREVHKFMDDEHADLVMRAVAWRGATAKTDPVSGGAVAAVAHAEHVHFRTATATILLAVAQAYLVGSVAMARSTLAKVDMAKASLLEIIMLLTLETALGEARDGAGNELDLASALELQQRVGNAHKSHKETLEALRDTWKLCIRSRVGPIGVQRVLMRIEARESHADMQYRLLLQRYSTHPTLLRSYGVFLQTLKGSTAAGARYIQVRL